MIYFKQYQTPNGMILAMCDEELIGKILKENKIELDLEKYSSFYKGELISEAEARDIVTTDELYSANIVGERSMHIVIEKGLVKREEVKHVSKVPFVHIYKIIY